MNVVLLEAKRSSIINLNSRFVKFKEQAKIDWFQDMQINNNSLEVLEKFFHTIGATGCASASVLSKINKGWSRFRYLLRY